MTGARLGALGFAMAFCSLLLLGCTSVPLPPTVLDPVARYAHRGTEVIVIYPNAPIERAFNPLGLTSSFAGMAGGNGEAVLGLLAVGLVLDSINDGVELYHLRDTKAKLASLRAAMGGYPLDPTSPQFPSGNVGAPPWLGVSNVLLEPDDATAEITNAENNAKAPQLLVLRYGAFVSPDFDCLVVTLTATMYRYSDADSAEAVPSGKRIDAAQRIYESHFRYDGFLPHARHESSSDTSRNIGMWIANDGWLAKWTLEQAVRGVNGMLAKGLTATSCDMVAIARERQFDYGGDLGGNVVEKTPSGELVYDKPATTWVFFAGQTGPAAQFVRWGDPSSCAALPSSGRRSKGNK